MARFQAGDPNGVAVQELEVLIRTAIFKPANALVQRTEFGSDRKRPTEQPALLSENQRGHFPRQPAASRHSFNEHESV